MNKLRILLSNDDGVFAEGINTLATVLSDIADIT
ncbi:MAG: 5'/3'-nucleotidase SurE, partial [Aliivibrio sp.]|nr:5'/3'-nucleotidase SurE [Aliivibrio sp.]